MATIGGLYSCHRVGGRHCVTCVRPAGARPGVGRRSGTASDSAWKRRLGSEPSESMTSGTPSVAGCELQGES